ncbi:MAG: hypothetical protein ACRCY4_09360, partial [Brevinema sp.]
TPPSKDGKKSTASKLIGIAVLSGLFISVYPIFMTLGIQSEEGQAGLSPLQFMALLSVGSFISAVLVNLIYPPKNVKPEDKMLRPIFIVFTALAGMAHYGGNVIQAIATPFLGTAIAWPLGQTMVLWSILWGVLYGEFKGPDSIRAYKFLGLSVLLFFSGILCFTRAIYF